MGRPNRPGSAVQADKINLSSFIYYYYYSFLYKSLVQAHSETLCAPPMARGGSEVCASCHIMAFEQDPSGALREKEGPTGKHHTHTAVLWRGGRGDQTWCCVGGGHGVEDSCGEAAWGVVMAGGGALGLVPFAPGTAHTFRELRNPGNLHPTGSNPNNPKSNPSTAETGNSKMPVL